MKSHLVIHIDPANINYSSGWWTAPVQIKPDLLRAHQDPGVRVAAEDLARLHGVRGPYP